MLVNCEKSNIFGENYHLIVILSSLECWRKKYVTKMLHLANYALHNIIVSDIKNFFWDQQKNNVQKIEEFSSKKNLYKLR